MYRNKKTGNLYQVIEHAATGCGDKLNGMELTVYVRDNVMYVREKGNFEAKFDVVDE